MWLSDSCAETGIFVTAGRGALNLIKHDKDGTIRSTVSGIGLTRCLNEAIVMVSATMVLRTGDRWNNPGFNRGCRSRRAPLLTLQQAVGSLRHTACVRRGLHAAYAALHRFLTSSEDSPYFAEPRGTAEEINWLYHLLWGWVEVIRLDLADPELWEAAMTTTSPRALSLRERLALPGFADTLFVVTGDNNEHVLFTIDARGKRGSFCFWTEGMEEIFALISVLSDHVHVTDEHTPNSRTSTASPRMQVLMQGTNQEGAAVQRLRQTIKQRQTYPYQRY